MSRRPGLDMALNLASRPFANTRPVVRVAILLWALSALLLAANVALFWGYLAGSAEQRARLARIGRDIERSQQRASELEQSVAGLDLARQNERVLFLNEKIAERTFSWSLLFDRVAEVLPPEVRLRRLTPSSGEEAGAGRRRRRSEGRAVGGSERVALTIGGEANSDEALLRFVDNLFAHPAFRDPNLVNESRDAPSGLITFDLRVGYLPASAAGAAPGPDTGGGPGEVTVEELPAPAEEPEVPAEPSAAGAGR